MAKRAIRYLYQEMLEVNIQIYEWNNSILHGKMAIVDNKWVTLGSYNLNHLSQYSSIEMNLEVLDDTFAIAVQNHLSTLLLQSTLIGADDFRQKMGRIDKILDWASYTLGRWIMSFLFFLVRREHRYKEKE
jgi:cardiolipin synthase